MKLINKFTVWYLVITLVVLMAGSLIIAYRIQVEIKRSERSRLESLIRQTKRQLQDGIPASSMEDDRLTIKELNRDSEKIRFSVVDTLAWYSKGQGKEDALKASESFKIDQKHYLITAFHFLPESDEIYEGITHSLIWIFLLLMVFILIIGRIISGFLLAPLHKTIHSMQSFNLRQKNKISLSNTSTHEFNELNTFLEKMTGKAVDDYRSLKEFTENASHELQTPLAIIRGKMELLTESQINDEQAKLIMAAYTAVEKLSKINQNLLLLSKLENQEYNTSQAVDFSEIISTSIESFRELIELKSIVLLTEIERNFTLRLNPVLAEILFTNLLSNAIRHNHAEGRILITLTASSLIIQNTGSAPEVPTEQLFERFKKSNQSSESIGLGLSIIKQICDLHQFDVVYDFINNFHVLEVKFKG